ncbi:hypothetical protein HETIRDRAFT_411040 [Heterobasidion irregulare TC 32-1]|uniref:Uncharacterized protein n=1 Tax=Heterobasidion irregulare (strain TC 32-1) TaxID=747525 RepID=W4K1Y2_HETIT|nr:uncharacterized protein HETIRDRAFT_411040 [Heterobasidion irregulare TC 32-1]ETW79345.1 hypothetical protein HETIRDRAFT_411040 [Heterobasidion irregulare TC 32-1]
MEKIKKEESRTKRNKQTSIGLKAGRTAGQNKVAARGRGKHACSVALLQRDLQAVSDPFFLLSRDVLGECARRANGVSLDERRCARKAPPEPQEVDLCCRVMAESLGHREGDNQYVRRWDMGWPMDVC